MLSISLKIKYLALLVISGASLSCAYFFEYVIGVEICPLCVYQRFPFLVIIFLSLVGYNDASLKGYYAAMTITIIFAMLLASYHVCVETGIIAPSKVCKPAPIIYYDLPISAFQKLLYNTPVGSCNKVTARIFGLSFAQLNLMLNAVLLIFWFKKTNTMVT